MKSKYKTIISYTVILLFIVLFFAMNEYVIYTVSYPHVYKISPITLDSPMQCFLIEVLTMKLFLSE
jgi:hypothetical protein